MKICPKCKCEWPDCIELCVCGTKLKTEYKAKDFEKAVDDFLKGHNPCDTTRRLII
jgi:hypothetical protein